MIKNISQPATTHLALNHRRLTTAEILYHFPDHPALLQSFVWQYLDRAPDFPYLNRFLDFWAHNLDGTLHSVRVAQASLPGEIKSAVHLLEFSSATRLN